MNWTISENNEDHILVGVGFLVEFGNIDDFLKKRGEKSRAWKFNILKRLRVSLENAIDSIDIRVIIVHIEREAMEHLIR